MKKTIAICSTTALVSLLCSVSLPKSVNAATFTYNLGDKTLGRNGNPRTRHSPYFTYETGINLDDPILTVSATDGDLTMEIEQRRNGVGVVGEEGPGGQIDRRGGTFEELLLSFNQPVSIVSASFTSKTVQDDDDFVLWVDEDMLVSRTQITNNNPFDFSSFLFEDTIGSNFTFTVSQSNDTYRLASVTVSTTGIPESTSVISLLGLGLMGLGSYRKTKNC